MTESHNLVDQAEYAPKRKRTKFDLILSFVVLPLTLITCAAIFVATAHWGNGWERTRSLVKENYQVSEVRPGPRGGMSMLTVVVGKSLHTCKRIPDDELAAKTPFTCSDGWVVEPK